MYALTRRGRRREIRMQLDEKFRQRKIGNGADRLGGKILRCGKILPQGEFLNGPGIQNAVIVVKPLDLLRRVHLPAVVEIEYLAEHDVLHKMEIVPEIERIVHFVREARAEAAERHHRLRSAVDPHAEMRAHAISGVR